MKSSLASLFSLPQDGTDAWRQKMWQKAEGLKEPLPRTAGFEYIPLAKYYARSYLPASSQSPLPDINSLVLPECRSSFLVYVDGFFRPELSSIPSSIVALPLPLALKSYGLFLQNRFQKILKEENDFFALFNGASHGSGLFLYIPPQTVLASPLQILHVSSEEKNSLALPRTHCVIGKEAHAEIIQSSSQGDCISLIDSVLDEEAKLSFYDLTLPSSKAWQMQSFRSELKLGAELKAFFLTTGSETVRTSFAIELIGEQSQALVKGLSLLSDSKQAHFHGRIEHKAPHATSRQHIKSILYDNSRSSFEGKIFVHSAAQKTEAYQTSQSLLLSPHATLFAKPNLEIFADDVKASHGATVSELDPEALFYLQSRGLCFADASALLVEGFCREFLEEIPFDSVRSQFGVGALPQTPPKDGVLWNPRCF